MNVITADALRFIQRVVIMDTKEVITMMGDMIECNAYNYRNILEQGEEIVLTEKNKDGETIEIRIRKKAD